jgi:hypothetical protein
VAGCCEYGDEPLGYGSAAIGFMGPGEMEFWGPCYKKKRQNSNLFSIYNGKIENTFGLYV